MKKKVYVVPHSHWDREWYFGIEESNILLSENLSFLIDYLEKNPEFKSYTFDAQISIVEEFLKVMPEKKEKLIELIKNKRLFVGPWYTQCDSLLINKESIIRNLLFGIKLGERYVHTLEVGYLPDIFGQNAYLPSIFKNFGLKSAIFQRGVYTDELEGNLNFLWESPDGEKIPTNNIFLGYGPGKFLSSDDEYVFEKLLPMLDKLSSLNKDSDTLLLPAGGDQVLIRTHFPQTVEEINKKLENYQLILSNYEDFMEECWKNKSFDNVIHGELRGTEKSRIHRTIGSSRYDIKYLNTKVENKILNILEPLTVLASKNGIEYSKLWIEEMWKLLFDAHAHDSIGGCNSDSTNDKIIARLEKVDMMCDTLLNILKKKIVFAISNKMKKENIFTLFNLDIVEKERGYEVVLFTKEKAFTVVTSENKEIDFEILNQEYISGGKQIVTTANGDREIELPGYYRSVIYFTRNISGLSCETFEIIDKKEKSIDNIESVDFKIKNEFLQLEFLNSNVDLINLKTEEKLEKVISFEDTRDFGDNYDYSPLENDEKIVIDSFELISVEIGKKVQRMVLKSRKLLPKELYSEEKQELEILTILELRERENFLRVKHSINNNIKDHRVRVQIKTPYENIENSYSNSGFTFIEHSTREKRMEFWREKGYAEAPVPIYNMESMMYVKSDISKFGVTTIGIKEYEIVDDKIALTLYRSVGLLGRDNLLWRPGRASGINNKVVETPKSQLLKELEFEYSIIWNEGKREEFYQLGNEYLDRYVSYQNQKLNSFEEPVDRFEIPLLEKDIKEKFQIQIDNKSIALSSLKRSFDGKSVILRLFNIGEKRESLRGISSENIYLSNLKEEKIRKVNEIEIEANSYITLIIE